MSSPSRLGVQASIMRLPGETPTPGARNVAPGRGLVVLLAVMFALLTFSGASSRALAADWSAFEDSPYVTGTEAMVVDGDGNVLYTRDASVSMPMASTTKVMTAIVALESGVSLDTVCTISEYAAGNQGTVAGYTAGEQATLFDLLRVMLIHSAGDAAVAIAENIAGSEEAFVSMMNAKAAELGLTGTHFTSPDGLSDVDHYSTPVDLIAMAQYAMKMPLFKSIVGTKSITISVSGVPTTFVNTDPLLNAYPGAQGVKTGYTYGAGRAFVGVCERGDVTIWFCVLGCDSEESRVQDLWSMLDWAYSKYPTTAMLQAGATLGYACDGYRFGRVLTITTQADVSLRTSPFDTAGSTLTTVSSSIAPTTFAMRGESVGSIAWIREGVAVVGRDISASTTSYALCNYGPFISCLFYELESAA